MGVTEGRGVDRLKELLSLNERRGAGRYGGARRDRRYFCQSRGLVLRTQLAPWETFLAHGRSIGLWLWLTVESVTQQSPEGRYDGCISSIAPYIEDMDVKDDNTPPSILSSYTPRAPPSDSRITSTCELRRWCALVLGHLIRNTKVWA